MTADPTTPGAQPPSYQFHHGQGADSLLQLSGNWTQGQALLDFHPVQAELHLHANATLTVDGSGLQDWDSALMVFLLRCHKCCQQEKITFSTRQLPPEAEKLLAVATAVKAHQPSPEPVKNWLSRLDLLHLPGRLGAAVAAHLAFVGELVGALARLLTGKSNTRFSDFRLCCYQAGPDAFPIISLTGVLVGMILAYLGAVQLQQFGAGIYVANLVVIGMLREMGVLMTAVVMAGRTGAAYAAQLGTMQTNDEIDAITTMGISPMEFLIVPRVLALVVTMPLLTLYANILGILGGGIVAGGMGITPLQYFSQGEGALSFVHLGIGLLKSVVYAVLIAIAGCRAGINASKSSAGVGAAATEAVVTSVIYLIVADAAINIIFQQLGI
jgi:phospholipid/cholesterol/gamma-HCH transport system permease protein